jgi:hypothetical protein
MDSKIEKMNRMRRNILFGVLIGTVLAFCLFMYFPVNSIFRITHRFTWLETKRFFDVALIFWLFTILIFITRYVLYKMKLIKDPALLKAVNDERVKLNWLRASRLAFIVVVSIAIFWKWYETGLYPDAWRLLPDPPWIIVFGAIISLVGSFLFYNRGGKREE